MERRQSAWPRGPVEPLDNIKSCRLTAISLFPAALAPRWLSFSPAASSCSVAAGRTPSTPPWPSSFQTSMFSGAKCCLPLPLREPRSHSPLEHDPCLRPRPFRGRAIRSNVAAMPVRMAAPRQGPSPVRCESEMLRDGGQVGDDEGVARGRRGVGSGSPGTRD